MLRKSFNLWMTSAEASWNIFFEFMWVTRTRMLHSSALLLQSLTRQAIFCFLWYWTYCAALHKSPVTSALLSIWISFSFPAHSLRLKESGCRWVSGFAPLRLREQLVLISFWHCTEPGGKKLRLWNTKQCNFVLEPPKCFSSALPWGILCFTMRSQLYKPSSWCTYVHTALSHHCKSVTQSERKWIAAVKPKKSCVTSCCVVASCSHDTQLLYSAIGDLQKIRRKNASFCRVMGWSAALCDGKDLTFFQWDCCKIDFDNEIHQDPIFSISNQGVKLKAYK